MKLSVKLLISATLPTIVLLLGLIYCVSAQIKSNDSFETYIKRIDQRQRIFFAIESNLGYGGGVHNFKNYLLRHDLDYKEHTVRKLNNTLALIAKYESFSPLSNTELDALKSIRITTMQYLNNVDLVSKLIAQNISIQDIDERVRIDDGPATNGIIMVKAEFQQLRDQQLASLISSQKYTLMVLIVTFVVVLFFSVVNTAVLSRRMVNALRALTRFTKQIGSSRSDVALPSAIPEEFVQLATQMVSMSAKIRSSQEQQKKLETSLIKINEELVEKNLQLAQFANMAAHDLREPARRINATCIALVEDVGQEVSEDAKFFLNSLKKQTSRMLQLISDLRYITKMGGHFRPEKKVFDFNIALDQICTEYEDEIVARKITIIREKLPEMGVFPNLVEVLYRNLIRNALNYTNDAVLIRFTYENGVFGVYNTGSQIDVNDAKKLFEPFKRGEKSVGSGLGLYISALVIEAHSGKIWMESEEGSVHFKFKFWSEA